jgi:hypothetical protein
MAINVKELTNEVTVAPEQTPGAGAGAGAGPVGGPLPEWACLARLREQHRRVQDDTWRTAAEGFDD